MVKEAQRGAIDLAAVGLAASHDADLVVAGVAGLFMGIALAEKIKRPFLQAYYIPFTPTKAFPSFLFFQLPSWLDGRVNRLTYHLTRLGTWQAFRSADTRARTEVLDLDPAPAQGPFEADCFRNGPVLYGYSPSVIPKPPDWGEDVHVTRYWFLDTDEAWRPPPDLAAFIAAGPLPVYVEFGSMSSQEPKKMTQLILRALSRTGQRAVLLSDWGGLEATDLPDTVFMVDSVPFTWLFPRTAAVVHHGDAGTTALGLWAGVPSVIVPFFGDQFFWGRHVRRLGVGPKHIPRSRLTSKRLARAIEEAVTDTAMRRRAHDLGARIQRENGVDRAVALVERMG
jgi:UDP:flavonoid glycosyltransferase YjiC (YdhE family)